MLALTSVDTSQAKAPPELADGHYSTTVVGWKVGPCRWSDELGTITFELRPNRAPDGTAVDYDITKRRMFKEFNVDPAKVDTYFYLNMFVDACGVKRGSKRPAEYLPETIGSEVEVAFSRRQYTKKDGTPGEASDVKMIIDGRVVTERRSD